MDCFTSVMPGVCSTGTEAEDNEQHESTQGREHITYSWSICLQFTGETLVKHSSSERRFLSRNLCVTDCKRVLKKGIDLPERASVAYEILDINC